MKYGLGKGLASLLSETTLSSNVNNEYVQIINIDDIEENLNHSRKNFEYDKIKELSDSILSHGLLQPIIVMKIYDKYKIIAGERRFRACKLAKLQNIHVIIKYVDDKESFEIALIDNIQREKLSLIEEAEAFAKLIQEFGYTDEQIAHKMNKTSTHVRNILSLNQLPISVKKKLNDGDLRIEHTKYLINNEDAELIANIIVKDELSINQTELLVKNWSKDKSNIEAPKFETDYIQQENDFKLVANNLSEQLNVKVTIENYTIGGKLILHYNNLEQLDLILSKINIE